jgi:hypothetical protein
MPSLSFSLRKSQFFSLILVHLITPNTAYEAHEQWSSSWRKYFILQSQRPSSVPHPQMDLKYTFRNIKLCFTFNRNARLNWRQQYPPFASAVSCWMCEQVWYVGSVLPGTHRSLTFLTQCLKLESHYQGVPLTVRATGKMNKRIFAD